MVLHAIKDCGLDGRSLSYPRPPIADRRVLLPHRTEFEEFKAQDVRDHRTVGIREGLASEV